MTWDAVLDRMIPYGVAPLTGPRTESTRLAPPVVVGLASPWRIPH